MILELNDGYNRRKPIEYKTNENNCFLVYSHHIANSGHVRIRTKKGYMGLHRYIYELHNGEIADESIVVRHKCDNPNCVNLEHLELGTHADNVQDRVKRNRSAKGIKNGRSKLSEDDVRFIRKSKHLSHTELSKKFNVDIKVISRVKNYETWKDVI